MTRRTSLLAPRCTPVQIAWQALRSAKMRLLCFASLLLASLTTVRAGAEPRSLIGKSWYVSEGKRMSS
ncbi:hypothetical protein IMZ48_30385 [Candidatus Bathyarchaeota archaeon]|nr:hypothetical protein [Candidatus Bathyarchaeota archaeon]